MLRRAGDRPEDAQVTLNESASGAGAGDGVRWTPGRGELVRTAGEQRVAEVGDEHQERCGDVDGIHPTAVSNGFGQQPLWTPLRGGGQQLPGLVQS